MTTLFSPPHPKAKPYDPYEPQYVRTYTGLKAFGTLCVLGIGVYVLLQAFLYLSAASEETPQERIAGLIDEDVMRQLQHPWSITDMSLHGPTRLLPEALYRVVVDSRRDGVMVKEFYDCHVTVHDQTPRLDGCHLKSRYPLEWYNRMLNRMLRE